MTFFVILCLLWIHVWGNADLSWTDKHIQYDTKPSILKWQEFRTWANLPSTGLYSEWSMYCILFLTNLTFQIGSTEWDWQYWGKPSKWTQIQRVQVKPTGQGMCGCSWGGGHKQTKQLSWLFLRSGPEKQTVWTSPEVYSLVQNVFATETSFYWIYSGRSLTRSVWFLPCEYIRPENSCSKHTT